MRTAMPSPSLTGKSLSLTPTASGEVHVDVEGLSLGRFPDFTSATAAAAEQLRHARPYVVAVIDTETTGLGDSDEVWEVAVIMHRDGAPAADEVALHLFVEHDESLTQRLPESFRADHDARYDPRAAVSRACAADQIIDLLAGQDLPVYLLGAVPSFDERVLLRLFDHASGRSGIEAHDPPWDYHLQDIECYARGWLHGRGVDVPMTVGSDDLAALTGFQTSDESGNELFARHTAVDDARWALHWFVHLSAAPVAG